MNTLLNPKKTLSIAISDLSNGPDILGVTQREEIGLGIYTIHVVRRGRLGRHFVAFRVNRSSVMPTIEVLRIFHEMMDLVHHFILILLPAVDFKGALAADKI